MRHVLKECGVSDDMSEILWAICHIRHGRKAPDSPKEFGEDLTLFAHYLLGIAGKVETYHHKSAREVCESLALQINGDSLAIPAFLQRNVEPIETCKICGNTESAWYADSVCKECSETGFEYDEDNSTVDDSDDSDPGNGGQGAKLEPEKPINPKGPAPAQSNDLNLILNLA